MLTKEISNEDMRPAMSMSPPSAAPISIAPDVDRSRDIGHSPILENLITHLKTHMLNFEHPDIMEVKMTTLVPKTEGTHFERCDLCEKCTKLYDRSICDKDHYHRFVGINYSLNDLSKTDLKCPFCIQFRKMLQEHLLANTAAGEVIDLKCVERLSVIQYHLEHQRFSRPRFHIWANMRTDTMEDIGNIGNIGNIGIAETVYYDPPSRNPLWEEQNVSLGNWIKGLLDECHNDYDCQERLIALKRLCRADGEIDLNFIDVQENCIVQGSSSFRYTALSYVWGSDKSPYLSLTNGNRTMLERAGSLAEHHGRIAPVIQDAMKITKQMGERYVWVDVLCIEQNNSEAKQYEIDQMDVIYQQALLTLVALSGKDSGSHLPGVSAPLGDVFEERTTIGGYTWVTLARETIGHEKFELYTWWYGRKREGQYAYPLRGWTFQEQLLSTRCIFFTPYYTIYSCHGNLQYPAPWPLKKLTDNNWTSWVSNLEASWTRCVGQIIKDPRTTDGVLTREKANDAMWLLYTDLVREYTKRRLTLESDTLNGFTGVIHCLERLFDTKFWCGVPEGHLYAALLFLPLRMVKRAGFPSWSWAGWLSPVIHLAYMPIVPNSTSFRSDWDTSDIVIEQAAMDPTQHTLSFQTQSISLRHFKWLVPHHEIVQYFDISLFETTQPGFREHEAICLSNKDLNLGFGEFAGFLYWDEGPKDSSPDERVTPSILDELVELVALSSTHCEPGEGENHQHSSDIYREWPSTRWINVMAVKSNERITVGKIRAEVWQSLNPETKHFTIR